MSVRCLTEHQKNYIKHFYTTKTKNQKELAEQFKVSERTINRVLEELGLATPVARIKGEAYQVMQLLKKYGVDYATLNQVLQDKFNAVA